MNRLDKVKFDDEYVRKMLQYQRNMDAWWVSYKDNPIKLTKDQADWLIEGILDTLCEVGNGTTDEDLSNAYIKLLRVRDYYFNMDEGFTKDE